MLALIAGLTATPALAGVGMSLSLANDDMFRGRSLSAGRPVAQADLAYDSADGLYAGLSLGGAVPRGKGLRLLDVQEYAGYARRLSPRLTLDLGVTNANFTEYASGGRSAGYAEFIAGLITPHLSGHLRVSPDYFHGGATLYGELDGMIGRADGWQLTLHGGLLRWLDDVRKPAAAPTNHYDLQAGVARRFDRLSGHLSYVVGGPDRDFYAGRERSNGAIVAGISFSF